jgi:electron transfer flavoprotein alpha subunit
LLSTLAILEQRAGELQHSSLGAVTAGKKLGGTVHALVAGGNVGSAAETAAKVDGLSKVLKVQNEAYERGLAESFAPMVVENIKKGDYTHVIASHSAFGKGLLPRVAALLDSQMLSDVMEIQSEDSTLLPSHNARMTSNTSRSLRPPDLCGECHPNRTEWGQGQILDGPRHLICGSRSGFRLR